MLDAILKMKVPKRGFHSHAIQGPFWFP